MRERKTKKERKKEKKKELPKMASDNVDKIYLSLLAGIFATFGSLSGKLSGNINGETTLLILLKFSLVLLMIISNTAGCTFFVKSLQGSGSSLPATVASAATNYFCSALIGFLVFGESTSLMWWTGTSLVLAGLLLICYTPNKNNYIKSKVTDKLKQR